MRRRGSELLLRVAIIYAASRCLPRFLDHQLVVSLLIVTLFLSSTRQHMCSYNIFSLILVHADNFTTERKFSSAPRCICFLHQKIYFGMLRKLDQKFAFTYPQSKCVCKVLPKTKKIYGLCKKTKIVM
jgi:hypothetical protein